MIEKIEMDIVDYQVLIEHEKCVINGKVCNLESEDVSDIIRIIRNWNYLYKNNQIIGENRYFIKIFSDGKEYIYRFENEFPRDFNMLVSCIGGIYDR